MAAAVAAFLGPNSASDLQSATAANRDKRGGGDGLFGRISLLNLRVDQL